MEGKPVLRHGSVLRSQVPRVSKSYQVMEYSVITLQGTEVSLLRETKRLKEEAAEQTAKKGGPLWA